MKRRTLISPVLAWSIALWAIVSPEGRGEDVLFQAMQDGLQRNMSELNMDELERPFFLSYTIDDVQELTIRGSLGTLNQSKLERTRYLTVDLRVGDYSLDNSNFFSGYYMRGASYFPVTIEVDYDAIRQRIYLATDKAYKDALKMHSKKKAYLQSRVIKDRPADFLQLPGYVYVDEAEPFDVDKDYFEELARAASEVFREYPSIMSSELELQIAVTNQYFVGSNESRSLRADRLYSLHLSMTGKSEEGEDITDADRIIVNQLGDVPDRQELIAWARGNAERMKALLAAETIDEYSGPVILTEAAAGEFFRQLFAANVANCPAPMFDNEDMAARYPGPELGNKIRRRVLPAFFDVYDDPTISSLADLTLIGGFGVDDAGGQPERVQLVEKGKLVNLLIGTAPTKKIKEPNGHARGAVSKHVKGRPGNMIFESGDQATLEELTQAMLEMCRDVDLEYGLVIKKLTDPNRQRRRVSFYGAQRESALSAPLEAYKVYADGSKVPVRNLEFSNVTVRILRDILQTGDQQFAHNYFIGDDYEMPVSIVCPAVLIEEMELKKTEGKVKKPPLLPSPLAGE